MEAQKIPSYLAWLTPKIRYDKKLSDKAKLIYAELCALSNAHGFAFPSNEFLAELYGVSNRTISRIIEELETNNYIKITIEKNRKGSFRKIFLTENTSGISGELAHDKNVYTPHENGDLAHDKNVQTHMTKMSSAFTINDTRSLNNTRESKNDFKITLSLVKKLVNDLNLNKMDAEVFYNYYHLQEFKYRNKKIDNLESLKSVLKLWESRERTEPNNSKSSNSMPDWMDEYIDEIKEVSTQ